MIEFGARLSLKDRSAIYAEQMRLNRDRADAGGTEDINKGCTIELSQADKDRLDEIAKLMAGVKSGAKKEG